MRKIPVFVDTNVLLYAASTHSSEVKKREAARNILTSGPFSISVQVAQEFFVNATRKLSPPLSKADALSFLQGINPSEIVSLDYLLFFEATQIQERFQISYWDAAVVAAAKRVEAIKLYSEDLSHGQIFEGVQVINPFHDQFHSKEKI